MRSHEASRRRLLLGVLPVCLLLLGFAGKVAVMEQAAHTGLAAYRAGDFRAAGGAFDRNRSLNVLEGWVAPFDTGDARYRAGDFEGAVEDFTVALDAVPHAQECTVRINLAMAYERLGDAAAERGDSAGARTAYEAGRVALTDGRCPSDAGQGDAQRRAAQQLDDALKRKLAQLPPAAQQPTPSPSPIPSVPSQQDQQLQQNNAQGEQQRQDSEQLQDSPPNGPDGYHW